MMTSFKDQAFKSATVAGTTIAGMYLLANDSANIQVGGIPLAFIAGGLNGISSIVSQFSYNKILSYIPYNKRFVNIESMILNGSIAFGATPGVLYLNGTINNMSDFAKLGLVTLGSDFLGDYIYENSLRNMLFLPHQRNRMPSKKNKV